MDAAAPTVLWRMFRQGRESIRAVILPGGPPFTLAYFSHDRMDRAENYESLELALFRSDELKQTLADDGWVEE